MPLHLHPDDDRVYACPHCDNAPIRRVEGRSKHGDGEFACYECRTTFDQPVERAAKPSGHQAAVLERLGIAGDVTEEMA